MPHGDAQYLADPADAEATYGPEEAVAFFRSMAAGEMPSVVSEGSTGGTSAQFICGFVGCDLRPCNPVLDALPPMLHLRGANRSSDRMYHLIEFALCELREPSVVQVAQPDQAGGQQVQDAAESFAHVHAVHAEQAQEGEQDPGHRIVDGRYGSERLPGGPSTGSGTGRSTSRCPAGPA